MKKTVAELVPLAQQNKDVWLRCSLVYYNGGIQLRPVGVGVFEYILLLEDESLDIKERDKEEDMQEKQEALALLKANVKKLEQEIANGS